MRLHGVVIGFASVWALAACGRTSLDFSDPAEIGTLDRDSEYDGVAVRHIAWESERSSVAPDDGVWLVFGSPPPNCVDPVVSGGGVGWHIATYIPPAELSDGVWDYADSGSRQADAHQAWFFSWHGNRQHDEQLHDGSLAIDELDDEFVLANVRGVVTAEPEGDLPDPERVDGDVAFTWCE